MADITEVFVFVSRHPDGTEGAVGGMLPDGSMMPLVAVDRERMEALMPVAQQIAQASGMEITVLAFRERAFEAVIRPSEVGA